MILFVRLVGGIPLIMRQAVPHPLLSNACYTRIPQTCNMTELGRYRPDAGSKRPTLARFWPHSPHSRPKCTMLVPIFVKKGVFFSIGGANSPKKKGSFFSHKSAKFWKGVKIIQVSSYTCHQNWWQRCTINHVVIFSDEFRTLQPANLSVVNVSL